MGPRLVRAMARPAPKGPLAVRFASLELEPVRAGAVAAAAVVAENAGTVAWRSHGEEGVQAAYHWLDDRGNPIVWDGERTPLPRPVEPGETVRLELRVRGPIPPGRYRLAVDLVAEHRAWFEELGSEPVGREVDVAARVARGLAVEGADPGVLDAQEEPVVAPEEAAAVAYLAPGVVPEPDWSRRILDAHQEGFAVVGGSVAVEAGRLSGRRARAALEPWKPGGGRVPGFPHPLLCPSVVRDVEAGWADAVEGLPALRPPDGEPWLYDGRVRVTARPRSGRRRG